MNLSARKAFTFEERKPAGFTLVELMIVVGIIAVITGGIVPNFNTYIETQNLRQARDQIITDLRSTQNKALTGVAYDPTKSHWGVKFFQNSGTYTFFTANANTTLSTACNNASGTNSQKLPGSVVIRELYAGQGNYCVFFSYENGDAYPNTGSMSYPLRLKFSKSGSNTCMYVFVNEVGYISGDPTGAACN